MPDLRYDQGSCEVVYLGFDEQRFSPSSTVRREPMVTCVAKLTGFKNVHLIIEAIRILANQGDQETQLHLVGVGDALPSLQRQAKQHAISDRVIFHGRLEDESLVQLLQRSRGLCLASVDEPFGLVTIEAMACGTPVIAINTGGPAEVIADTNAGILIDARIQCRSRGLFTRSTAMIIDSPLVPALQSLGRRIFIGTGPLIDWKRSLTRHCAVARKCWLKS